MHRTTSRLHNPFQHCNDLPLCGGELLKRHVVEGTLSIDDVCHSARVQQKQPVTVVPYVVPITTDAQLVLLVLYDASFQRLISPVEVEPDMTFVQLSLPDVRHTEHETKLVIAFRDDGVLGEYNSTLTFAGTCDFREDEADYDGVYETRDERLYDEKDDAFRTLASHSASAITDRHGRFHGQ